MAFPCAGCRTTNYRRDRTPGGTWFFTLSLADRKARLLVERIAHLRCALRSVQRQHPFTLDAIVVLPHHLHAIWTLPSGDSDFSLRWRLIKSRFSHSQPCAEHISLSRLQKRERGIWQRRFWEHAIRGEADLRAHVDYIHFNPVKHGLVSRVSDWRWSSFHRYVRAGVLPADWGGALGHASDWSGERGAVRE